MATQTFPFASFNNDAVKVELDVNDANWRPSRVRCINNSNYSLKATILESGVVKFTAIAPPNQTTSWNISGIQLGWDAVDGGLILGNYELQTQYPSS
jgi:hypothetical protein